MRTERKEIQKIEHATIYIANDGTEFRDEDECRKYENTAECAIKEMFNKLNPQVTYNVGDSNPFYVLGCDDDLYAVKIENTNQLEIVNKWIRVQDKYQSNTLGDDAIGTIQLINNYLDGILILGTPEQLKEKYCEAIDQLFDKLVEKSEEPKGENV